MKEQIQQVQAYFSSKILSGEIEVSKASEHTINFSIDNDYSFCFWICSGADNCRQWNSSGENFIILPEPTEEEAKAIFEALQPHYAKFMKEVTIKEKQEELAKLSEEINSINNL